MSAAPPSPENPRRFALRPAPPVRALAIAAGAAVVGALLIVGWAAGDWPALLLVPGGLLLVAGVALAVAALLLTHRLRSTVDTDDRGLVLVRAGQRRRYAWTEIKQVRQSGPRLRFATRDGRPDPTVVSPRGAGDPTFTALIDDVRQRMDASRR